MTQKHTPRRTYRTPTDPPRTLGGLLVYAALPATLVLAWVLTTAPLLAGAAVAGLLAGVALTALVLRRTRRRAGAGGADPATALH